MIEEMRQPDDLDAIRRRGEQAVQGPCRALAVRQDDQVGALLVDDPGQLGDRPEARVVGRLVVDGPHDGEGQSPLELDHLSDLGGGRGGPNDEYAPLRDQALGDRFPDRGQREDREGEGDDRPAGHPEARNPESESRRSDEARGRSDGAADRDAEREVHRGKRAP